MAARPGDSKNCKNQKSQEFQKYKSEKATTPKNSKNRKLSQKAVVSMLKDMLIKKVEVRLSKDWQNQKFFAATAEEVARLRRASSTVDSNGFSDEEIFAEGGEFKKVEVCLSKNWQTQEPFAAKVEEVICSLRGSSMGEKVVEKKLTRRLPAREKRPASQGRPKEGTRLKVMKGGKFCLSSVVMTRHSAAKVH